MWVWVFFFFNDTATTEIYTLSLHDALPISNFSQVPKDLSRVERTIARVLSYECGALGYDNDAERVRLARVIALALRRTGAL